MDQSIEEQPGRVVQKKKRERRGTKNIEAISQDYNFTILKKKKEKKRRLTVSHRRIFCCFFFFCFFILFSYFLFLFFFSFILFYFIPNPQGLCFLFPRFVPFGTVCKQ